MPSKKNPTPKTRARKPGAIDPDLVEAIERACTIARLTDQPLVSEALRHVLFGIVGQRTDVLERMVSAADTAERGHDRRSAEDRVAHVASEVKGRISRPGPPPGEDADALARLFALGLRAWPPSSADDLYSVDAAQSIIRKAFPDRLVIDGRVFVSSDVKHRRFEPGRPAKGAKSPRRGQAQCRCPECVAQRLTRAAERAVERWTVDQGLE